MTNVNAAGALRTDRLKLGGCVQRLGNTILHVDREVRQLLERGLVESLPENSLIELRDCNGPDERPMSMSIDNAPAEDRWSKGRTTGEVVQEAHDRRASLSDCAKRFRLKSRMSTNGSAGFEFKERGDCGRIQRGVVVPLVYPQRDSLHSKQPQESHGFIL